MYKFLRSCINRGVTSRYNTIQIEYSLIKTKFIFPHYEFLHGTRADGVFRGPVISHDIHHLPGKIKNQTKLKKKDQNQTKTSAKIKPKKKPEMNDFLGTSVPKYPNI